MECNSCQETGVRLWRILRDHTNHGDYYTPLYHSLLCLKCCIIEQEIMPELSAANNYSIGNRVPAIKDGEDWVFLYEIDEDPGVIREWLSLPLLK